MVSLPSIREMFPQFMAGTPGFSPMPSHPVSALRPSRDAGWRDRYPQPSYPTTTTKPLFITKPIQPVDAYRSSNWSPVLHSPLSLPGSPMLPKSPSAHTPIPRRQRGSTSPRRPLVSNTKLIPSATPDAPAYSFGVFKSNPDSASLDHIASSTSLRRGKSTSGQQSLPAEVAKGATPGFVVAVSPPAAPHPSASQPTDGCNIDSDGSADGGNASPFLPPATYSSFLLSDSNANSDISGQGTIFIGDQDQGNNGGPQRSTEKGKVHECPHCSKRFNRPSSLQIHANTHTGARPFRCPHPNCGREFNVNSNMRRHYRNHARPTFSRAHPPNSKSIRRRMERISEGTLALVGVGTLTASPDAAASREPTAFLRSPRNPRTSASDESGGDTGYDAEDGRRSESPESVWDHETNEAIGSRDRNQLREDDEDCDTSIRGYRFIPTSQIRQLGCDQAPSHENTRRSSSPTPCNSSRLQHSGEKLDQTSPQSNSYTPSSAVYLQSCTELNVSTVLRPAFSSPMPLRSNFVQEGLVVW